MAIYFGGLLAAPASRRSSSARRFGTGPERGASVTIGPFHGPLGAWVMLWGAAAMVASAPFDDWWHDAYGLDVRVISPPHAVLALGMVGVVAGAMLLDPLRAERRARSRRPGERRALRLGVRGARDARGDLHRRVHVSAPPARRGSSMRSRAPSFRSSSSATARASKLSLARYARRRDLHGDRRRDGLGAPALPGAAAPRPDLQPDHADGALLFPAPDRAPGARDGLCPLAVEGAAVGHPSRRRRSASRFSGVFLARPVAFRVVPDDAGVPELVLRRGSVLVVLVPSGHAVAVRVPGRDALDRARPSRSPRCSRSPPRGRASPRDRGCAGSGGDAGAAAAPRGSPPGGGHASRRRRSSPRARREPRHVLRRDGGPLPRPRDGPASRRRARPGGDLRAAGSRRASPG